MLFCAGSVYTTAPSHNISLEVELSTVWLFFKGKEEFVWQPKTHANSKAQIFKSVHESEELSLTWPVWTSAGQQQ